MTKAASGSSDPVFVPSWKVGVNTRATDPEVAIEMLLKGVLPQDAAHMAKLSITALSDVVATTFAASHVALSELYVRCHSLSRSQETATEEFDKIMKEHEEAKKHTELAWKETEDARAAAVQARDTAFAERDSALVMAESMKTTHAEYAKRRDEEEKQKLVSAREEGRMEGRQAVLAQFTSDLKILAMPVYMLGFTKAVDEVAPLLDEQMRADLQDHDSYNPRAFVLVNLLAEGIQQNCNLSEIEAKFIADIEEASIDELFGVSPAREELGDGCSEVPHSTAEAGGAEEAAGGAEAATAGAEAGAKENIRHKCTCIKQG